VPFALYRRAATCSASISSPWSSAYAMHSWSSAPTKPRQGTSGESRMKIQDRLKKTMNIVSNENNPFYNGFSKHRSINGCSPIT
jgi:hypothetical protein